MVAFVLVASEPRTREGGDHPSSWWLLGTRTLGDSRGRREELAAPQEEEMVVACPELLLPVPATSSSYRCHPRLLLHLSRHPTRSPPLPNETQIERRRRSPPSPLHPLHPPPTPERPPPPWPHEGQRRCPQVPVRRGGSFAGARMHR
jgi:hypothetical protein